MAEEPLPGLNQGEYLVCYEHPRESGLRGGLVAPTRAAIEVKFPELLIADSVPPWLDPEYLARKREDPLWLDDEPPQGLLRALVTDRSRG